MQDLSLSDVAWIFGSLITLVIAVRLARPVWLLLGALRRRYLVVDWAGIRAVLADDMSSDEHEPPESLAEPEPARSASEPRGTAFAGSLNAGELRLNADEIAAVRRMIEHKMTAVKPSKSSTIQAGFGVSRGGAALYQRASLIYDTLFGSPEPVVQFRPLDADSRPILR